MTSTKTIDFLSPVLPNEIVRQILHDLDFYSLLSGFFVNGLWAKTIYQDDKLREKMFRLPGRLSKDTTKASLKETRSFIEDLWKNVDASVNPTDLKEDPWHRVEINPLFDTEDKVIFLCGTYNFTSNGVFDVDELTIIPTRHHPLLQALCGSMVITYPPVQHVKFATFRTNKKPGAECWTHRSKGVTVQDLLEELQVTSTGLTTLFPWELTSKPRFKYDWISLWHKALYDLLGGRISGKGLHDLLGGRISGKGLHDKVLDNEDLFAPGSLVDHWTRKQRKP